MLKPVLFATLFFTLLPAAVPTVQASSFSLNTPGLSINIGDRDRRGYYWDGYRWRDHGWWNERHPPRRPMPPPRYHHSDHGRPHYDHRRGPDRGRGHDDRRGGHGDHRH